jgi:hypothetical protein
MSPHQFGVLTLGGCEAIVLGIRTFFNLHLYWAMMKVDVENAFNIIFVIAIFRKLCDAGGPLVNIVPLPSCFMVFIFLFTTSMGGLWKGSSLLIYF